jgi:lipoprotein-anchoring transpeptidase ErfK/SrfK
MYRIHGTNQPWSIGLSLSSGCIRMMNQDVEDLYERTPIGSKVIVVGPNDRKERYLTDISNPIRFIFGG